MSVCLREPQMAGASVEPGMERVVLVKLLGIIVGAIAIGLGGGAAALFLLGDQLGLQPTPAVKAPTTGEPAQAKPQEPLFYNVQTWFEFTSPANGESLGEMVADDVSGLSLLPPKGFVAATTSEIQEQAAERPQSSLRLGQEGFDTGSVVWMLRSEDGRASIVVRSKPQPEEIGPVDYEDIFNRYSEGMTTFLSQLGIDDVTVEGAFFQDGLGIYAKFVDPGPPESLIHTVQVLGTPNGNVISLTFSRSIDRMPPDWESVVQASIESLTVGGPAQ